MTIQKVAILFCSCQGGIRLATVFTVDDEPAILEVYKDILEMKEHEVVAEAYDGEEAVKKFTVMDRKPDVIIMDHRMPYKNGIETMKEIHAIDPLQCVIFVTADYTAAKDAVLMGANSFLLKPFRMDNLFNAIGTALYEMEEKKSRIRENLLGIVSKNKSNDPKALMQVCGAIEKEVIDLYLKGKSSEKADLEQSVGWSCRLLNLCGFEFGSTKKSDEIIYLNNNVCYWMDKYGPDPIFCTVTKCILTRFAMKSGREVTLNTKKSLMNDDDCCYFEVYV